MSELLNNQIAFARLIPRLIDKAFELGYEVTIGDVFRDPRAFGEMGKTIAYGNPRSAHKQKLAIDLNLYKNGNYLPNTEDHQQLGGWWKKQHPLARWGGDFGKNNLDGNHYSFEYNGIK